MFTVFEAAQGVLHIQDALGVCFTLVQGEKSGLLIDTGYGLESVRAFADSLAGVPYQVVLTHGHHDHILGAADFHEVYLCGADREEYRLRSGERQRSLIAERAREAGLAIPEDYLTRPMPEPEAMDFPDQRCGFESRTFDLGGLHAEAIHVPGHTPGSIVIWIPERKLLLTGDDWNPCTWLWFPSSLGARTWRSSMRRLLELPAERVLCSHQPRDWARKELTDYLDWLSDGTLENAPAAESGTQIRTRKAEWRERGFEFMFDWDKKDL